MSTLQESVTGARFEALRRYFRTTRYVQISTLIGEGAFFSSSLIFSEGHSTSPFDEILLNNLVIVLFFSVYVALTVVALSLDSVNPTEKRLGYSTYASFFAWIFGFIGLLGSSPSALDVRYLPAFIVAPTVMFLPALLRSIPMVDFANRRHRGSPPGHYGNLKGIIAEIMLESRNSLRIKYTLIITFVFVALVLGGVAKVLARAPVTDWNLFLLITGGSILATLPVAVGASFLIVRSPGKCVLDTYQQGKLWYYTTADKLANFFVAPHSVREMDAGTVVFNTLHSAGVRLKTRNESEFAILLSVLGSGEKGPALSSQGSPTVSHLDFREEFDF